MIIHAFVSSHRYYCNCISTCLSKVSNDRLHLVQNAAARLLTRSSKYCHITPVLASLHWLPVSLRIQFKVLVITYRALHCQAAEYLSDLLHAYMFPVGQLCLLTRVYWLSPTMKTKGDRAFASVAPRLRNAPNARAPSSPIHKSPAIQDAIRQVQLNKGLNNLVLGKTPCSCTILLYWLIQKYEC